VRVRRPLVLDCPFELGAAGRAGKARARIDRLARLLALAPVPKAGVGNEMKCLGSKLRSVVLGLGVLATVGPDVGGRLASSGVAPTGRGIARNSPWVSFYGTARQMGDLRAVAARFRLINIDADPGAGNFTRAQIATLRGGGRNTVISYLNIGTCEKDRTYFTQVPEGLLSCGANARAQLGGSRNYPREVWMNPANEDYKRLLLSYVAPRLAATGVNGFFLDNFEIVEHGPHDPEAPCDTKCVQGALMLVSELRRAFPALVIVMQNATSAVTRDAKVGGVPFASLLDGVSREEAYAPHPDATAESELVAWRSLGLTVAGRPFSITTEDYVGGCHNTRLARRVYTRSRRQGFSPYATISSENQDTVCFWPF
jgi:cysteinyl-tRNA synthetase, unknown class